MAQTDSPIMRETLFFLRVTFLYPFGNKPIIKRSLVAVILACFLFVGGIFYIVNTMKVSHLFARRAFQVVWTNFGCFYFTLFLVLKQKQLMKLVVDLSDFKTFGKPYTFDYRNSVITKLRRLFIFLIVSDVLMVFIFPLVYIKPCEEANKKNAIKEACGLPAPIWLPRIAYDQYPAKYFIYAGQAFSFYIFGLGTGNCACMIPEAMEHLVTKIQHLKFLIVKVVNENQPRKRREMLRLWVQYHQFILSIGDNINICFMWTLSSILFICAIMFAISSYNAMTDKVSIDSFGAFGAWCQSMILCSVTAQHVVDESLGIAEAVYNSEWYDKDVNFQKDLLFILMRTQRPIMIKAGPFAFLSNALMLKVFQSAYSYLNLLSLATST